VKIKRERYYDDSRYRSHEKKPWSVPLWCLKNYEGPLKQHVNNLTKRFQKDEYNVIN
jgi:hypothetical protein